MLGNDQAAKSFRIDTPLDSELLRAPNPSPTSEEMISTHIVATIDPFSNAITLAQGIDVQPATGPSPARRISTPDAVTAITSLDPPSFILERPNPEAMNTESQDTQSATSMPDLEEAIVYDTRSPPYVPHTGGKGWCLDPVHCKYIARKWTKNLANTHPEYSKDIQNFLSQFNWNFPSSGNTWDIHSVPR